MNSTLACSSTARRSRRALSVATAVAFAVGAGGSFCPETQQAGSGNLDRPQGVAVFSVDGAPYALLPMTAQRHLRVFSLTSRIFVPAPNLYFPLSIPAGPHSARLAIDEAHRLAWVLDSADGGLRAIRLGVAADPAALTRVGAAIPVGLAPSGVAVDPASSTPRLWVASARSAEVLELTTDQDAGAVELTRRWTVGAQPSDLAYDAASGQLLVADAASHAVTLLHVDSGAVRAVDVGGPSARVRLARAFLSAERTDEAVALALRLDAPELAVLTPGQTEPLLARVELPDLAVDAVLLGAASAGDATCAGIDRTEACAYAAILEQKGLVTYLDLNSVDGAGRLLPQIFDDNTEPPDLSADPNVEPTLYDAGSDDPQAQAQRPLVVTSTVEDLGQPPHVRQAGSATLLFTYQGVVAPLRERAARYEDALARLVDLTAEQRGLELADLGARAGDLVEIPAQDGCPELQRVPVLEVSGPGLVVLSSSGALDCLRASGGLRYSLRAGGVFTVAAAREEVATSILGRTGWDEPWDAHVLLVTLRQAAAGPPPTGAVIGVPVRDNFSPRTIDLGTAGALPTGIAWSLVGPSEERVPRLIVSAAGGSALFVLAPGLSGYIGDAYLVTGAERFE